MTAFLIIIGILFILYGLIVLSVGSGTKFFLVWIALGLACGAAASTGGTGKAGDIGGETKDGASSEGCRLSLDAPTMSAILDGDRVMLKAKEFALLKCLYEHKNTIVTKEKLFDEVWGDSFYSDGTLNVHIRKLREKLEKDPNNPEIIKTVWGTGYILEL